MLFLFVSPAFEDTLVDWLLARDDVDGFVSARVEGHGITHEALSFAEQVSGRQRLQSLQLFLSEEKARAVVAALRAAFPRAPVAFQLLAVLDGGRVGAA